jgi:hypothetical protein
MTTQNLAIVTPSYSRDLERCRLTVDSVNRFVDEDIHHYLVIDRRDIPLFKRFEGPRTTIVTAEDLLPWWIVRIPRVRKVWMSFKTLPVRSWIVQQLMKLSVASAIDADVFCFVDSDVAFLRPTGRDAFVNDDGSVRLFRRPDHANMPSHQRWHRSSARLLGLEERDYFGADFIGNMITWRRDSLLAMQKHIESVTGKHWVRAVAGELHLSEYILYGIYAEHVAGFDASGHEPQAFDLCHCSWDYDINGPDDIDAFFKRELDERIRAVLVQSNLKLSPEAYAKRVAELQEKLNAKPV